ncbi:MAG: NADP-dependent oxidoreductase [Polyangiaceae bacterium]|nr:NADP-dependent oxidoreductase [Polyangiaceae bacterium]MCB9609268.1 NADP-dependent oxidoreductase [Polyangiaceae bacterium]
MLAARIHTYGPPSVLQVENTTEPTCGPRDVLIEVHASSVNPVDFKIRGGYQRGVIRYRLPWTLGLDVSGVVVEVGAKVKRFRVGDEVVSSPTHRRQGCYAEYVAIDEAMVAKKAARITHAEAASLPLVALTAWEALFGFGRLEPGQKVFVQAGAGGVGSVAIQLARHFGAAEVAATCSTRNVELVESLGATRVVDYTKEEYDEVLRDYDIVLDALGGEHKERAFKVLKKGGALASIVAGIPTATEKYGPNLGVLVAGVQMLGFSLRARLKGKRAANLMRKSDGELLGRIMNLVEDGSVKPLIDRTYPLEEIVEAHRYAETGRARGKVVIQVR